MSSKTLVFTSAALVYGAFAQGGFYRPQALTLLALTAIAVFVSGPLMAWRDWFRLPRSTQIGIIITGLGITTAIVVRPITDSILSVAVHLTAVLAAILGVRLGRRAEFVQILRLLSWTGVAVALIGLVGVAFHNEPLALEAQGNWRAASTLTYANAMAALLVPCLAAAMLRIRQAAPTATLEGAIIIGGFIASMSRGSALGVALGVVLVLATGGRGLLAAATRSLLGGLVIGAAAIPSVFGPSRPWLVAIGLLAGILATTAGSSMSRLLKRWPVALALIGATAAVALLFAPRMTSEIVDRALNEDRLQIWQAAWDAGREGPLFGQGLGRFEVYEVRYGTLFRIRYAHNEFLQALVETGWPGAAALATGSAFGAWGLWARRRRDDVWYLAVLVVTTFGIHGLTDFIWHVPAVGFATALWYGAAVSRAIEPSVSVEPVGS